MQNLLLLLSCNREKNFTQLFPVINHRAKCSFFHCIRSKGAGERDRKNVEASISNERRITTNNNNNERESWKKRCGVLKQTVINNNVGVDQKYALQSRLQSASGAVLFSDAYFFYGRTNKEKKKMSIIFDVFANDSFFPPFDDFIFKCNANICTQCAQCTCAIGQSTLYWKCFTMKTRTNHFINDSNRSALTKYIYLAFICTFSFLSLTRSLFRHTRPNLP